MLERILEAKRRELDERKKKEPLSRLKNRLEAAPRPRDFKGSLKGNGIQLIGEIKKISPSQGLLRKAFDPVALAKTYEKSGAACLSVLTDEPFFGGHLSYLASVKAAVELPVLRKDFILEEYQIYESAVASADAVLLICAILSEKEMAHLMQLAATYQLASLVEVHSEEDLEKALSLGADMIGINNRDLRTFKLDLQTSERLVKRIPKGKMVVSESGIHSHEEVERLERLGVHAVLIGQTFMQRPDLENAIHEVMGK